MKGVAVFLKPVMFDIILTFSIYLVSSYGYTMVFILVCQIFSKGSEFKHTKGGFVRQSIESLFRCFRKFGFIYSTDAC